MRVGIVHYGLDRQPTGIGRYIIELTNALAALGVCVHPLWAGRRPVRAGGESRLVSIGMNGIFDFLPQVSILVK